MRVEPLSYREFDQGSVQRSDRSKPFLPGGRSRGEVPPPPPSFSEEELKKAELESYKRGFHEGTEEGRRLQTDAQAEIERQLSEALINLTAAVHPILEDYQRMAAMLREQMPKVALAVSKKVAGDALTENATAAVSAIIERCVISMLGEPQLSVTVHESLADTLEKRLDALRKRFSAATEIVVLKDSNIPVTDCKVAWKHGSFTRNTEQLWKEIEVAIGNMAASAAHQAKNAMEVLTTKVNEPTIPPETIQTAPEPPGAPEQGTPQQAAAPAENTETQPSQKE